jgi:hypothetical protein
MDSTNNPKDYRFQRILQEAAAYRTLRQVFDTLSDDGDNKDRDAVRPQPPDDVNRGSE